MTFDVIGAAVPEQLPNGYAAAMVAAICRHCGFPIAVRYRPDSGITAANFRAKINEIVSSRIDFHRPDLIRLDTWPKAEALQIPDYLPADVERAFLQAEKNFRLPDCEEAAAIMYRRSLEVGLKIGYPEMTGSLAQRIRKLVGEHHLPAPIGEWLDQVRLIGNDGAHEQEGVSPEDLKACRDFVDMALRYIFTMPAQIAARRNLPPGVA